VTPPIPRIDGRSNGHSSKSAPGNGGRNRYGLGSSAKNDRSVNSRQFWQAPQRMGSGARGLGCHRRTPSGHRRGAERSNGAGGRRTLDLNILEVDGVRRERSHPWTQRPGAQAASPSWPQRPRRFDVDNVHDVDEHAACVVHRYRRHDRDGHEMPLPPIVAPSLPRPSSASRGTAPRERRGRRRLTRTADAGGSMAFGPTSVHRAGGQPSSCWSLPTA
jgi:hypothetical protein